MEHNNPNKPKDNEHYLNIIKRDILYYTKNGENNNTVFLHNDYEAQNGQIENIAKYYNPRYDEESGFYEIHRLIPSPESGMFTNSLMYIFHEDSMVILSKRTRWDGNIRRLLPLSR